MLSPKPAAALLALILVATPSLAQVGRSSSDLACESDVHRRCEDVFPDVHRVAACLVDKRQDLTQDCAEQLARPPQSEDAD